MRFQNGKRFICRAGFQSFETMSFETVDNVEANENLVLDDQKRLIVQIINPKDAHQTSNNQPFVWFGAQSVFPTTVI